MLHIFFYSAMECSVLMWTSMSHQLLPRLRVHCEQYGAETVRTGSGGVDDYMETFTRYFREVAHTDSCSCDNRFKTCTSLSIKNSTDWREEVVPNSPQLFVVDSYCESQFSLRL